MRQRQREASCGVEIAATCTRLPPTPALTSSVARSATNTCGLRVLHLQRPPVQLVPLNFSITASASAAVAISTKPNPRESPCLGGREGSDAGGMLTRVLLAARPVDSASGQPHSPAAALQTLHGFVGLASPSSGPAGATSVRGAAVRPGRELDWSRHSRPRPHVLRGSTGARCH